MPADSTYLLEEVTASADFLASSTDQRNRGLVLELHHGENIIMGRKVFWRTKVDTPKGQPPVIVIEFQYRHSDTKPLPVDKMAVFFKGRQLMMTQNMTITMANGETYSCTRNLEFRLA